MPYITPDDNDPARPAGPAPEALPALDALDLPPHGYADADPRPIVEGEEALSLVTKAVCLTILALAILAAIVPAWVNGVLLLAAPASVGIITVRHRLNTNARTALGAMAIGYIAMVLLYVG